MFNLINKKETGDLFEAFTQKTLNELGYKIVETNYACKLGEVDIILKDNQHLVFMEVRYRQKQNFGGAVLSVDKKKQHKLIQTASFYLQQKNLTNKLCCRFDVFAIQGKLPNPRYDWIKGAFTA
jgi:putative endonuclease